MTALQPLKSDVFRCGYSNCGAQLVKCHNYAIKANTTQKPKWWWSLGKEERVYTGHANGRITINVREADTVEREKARVLFQEAHRTVIGHGPPIVAKMQYVHDLLRNSARPIPHVRFRRQRRKRKNERRRR